MKIEVDSHTHSISSGHAYSTIQEMAKEAANNGIKMIVITDHGPSMWGSPCLYHFGNLKVLPKELYGVKILKGAEANIIKYNGEIDIPDEYLIHLDFVLAGFHEICIKPSTIEDHTKALINALKNPLIDTISHPGNPQYQVNIEKVVSAAKEYNKCIEINNHSFQMRTGSEENCKNFAIKCKEFNVKMVCGSDAHISFDIGKFNQIYKLFKENNITEEMVLNSSVKNFENYINIKKNRLNLKF